MFFDCVCGKNFYEMVYDVFSVVNNYGFNFNVRGFIEIGFVDGEVFVYFGVSDGKCGVIGVLFNDQYFRIFRFVDEFREYCGIYFKVWIYLCYVVKFSKSCLDKNEYSESKIVLNFF